MKEFPKIETLYNRGENFKVKPGELRMEEFGNIKTWHVTEKVDGTNIRVGLMNDGSVQFGGRTDAAQIPANLVQYLVETFTPAKMQSVFPYYPEQEVVLYGEGYGEKIQKGGGNYRKGVSFRLFDVLVGQWWLEPDNIGDVADKLGIKTAPVLHSINWLPNTKQLLLDMFVDRNGNPFSIVACEDGGSPCQAEGIIARPSPMLFDKHGHRIMWKLKFSDFE